MLSYEREFKNLKRNNSNFENANIIKNKWYDYYLSRFINLANNMIKRENLPNQIPPLFLENCLNRYGYIAFFKEKDLGFFVQHGTFTNKLDIYDQPTGFQIINNDLTSFFNKKNLKVLNYYDDKIEEDNCIIISNTPFNEPSYHSFTFFAEKLAIVETLISTNLNGQRTPYILLTDEESKLTMKNLYQKINNGEPVITLDIKRNKDGTTNREQLSDFVTVLNTQTPYLVDRLEVEKQVIIKDFLTYVGIDTTIEKSERLIKSEVTASQGLVNASLDVKMSARKQGVDLINRLFDLDIKVKANKDNDLTGIESGENDEPIYD